MLRKSEVQYEHPAKGKNHCSMCVHYLGGACEIVAGVIHPEDWCNQFKKDTMAHHDMAMSALAHGEHKGPKPKKEVRRMIIDKAHGGYHVTHEHTHPEHHPHEEHVVSGKDGDHMDALHDHLEQHMGEPNPGEEAEEQQEAALGY